MKTQGNTPILIAISCLFITTWLTPVANATPYASGVSNVSGTVSFILNESADSVMVITNSPEGVTGTNDLGGLAKGTHSFSLGSATNFSIVVYKNSGPGYRWADGGSVTTGSGTWRTSTILEISDPTSSLLLFNSPRGMAINRRADSPYFGRVYVCNSANQSGDGLHTNALGVVRNLASADGIYLLNADGTDALGQGDTALTGGLNWTTSSESPNRLHLGPDDRLYICDRGSTTSAGLYMTDPEVSATSGTNILVAFSGTTQFPIGTGNTHGRIDCVDVTGSLDTSNLRIYMQDVDLQPDKTTSTSSKRNCIWRSDSGDLLSWAKLPFPGEFTLTGDKFTSPQNAQTAAWGVASDYEKGANGYYYVNIFKDDGNTFWVFNGSFSGGGLFNARNAGDTVLSGLSLGLAPDQKYVGIGTRYNGYLIVYPTDGGYVPVHARRVFLPIGPGGNDSSQRVREVRFDAANNMYALPENMGLRTFSPGGASIATTTGSANATYGESFSVQFGPAINPQPASRVNNAGTTATFSITADGTAPLSYQWFKNGALLNGATGTAFSLPGVTCAADDGSYHVVVSNAVGVVTSLVATLTVTDPVISVQPVNQTNVPGSTASFTVTAMGSPTLLFQWKHAGTNLLNGPTGSGSTISGATTATLSIANVSLDDADTGNYEVEVTSSASCANNVATSQQVTLAVEAPPPPPVLSSIEWFYGAPRLNVTGPIGQTYQVLYSTNLSLPLSSWTPLVTNTFSGGPDVYDDFSANPQQGFYRLQSP